VFEKRVLRRIFGEKKEEMVEGCRELIVRGFTTCTLLQV
jgi:hypothetical protein